MSQYVYNKHNTTCKLLRMVAHSFDFWYKNNEWVNTVRQHFPWRFSIFVLNYLSVLVYTKTIIHLSVGG